MKKVFLIIALICTSVLAKAQDQDQSDVRLSNEMIKLALSAERKELFTEGMNEVLKPEHAKAFWAIFDIYLKERSEIDGEFVKFATQYSNDFNKMPDKEINDLINQSTKISKEQELIRTKYFKKIKAKTTTTIAARFFQIDNYITSVSRVALMDQIPFIGDEIQVE
jgi:hypothetical protein